MAGVVTRNHFHFGGAGKYSRMALAEDCIGFATSAHRFTPGAGQSILSASGGSPMSFAIPAGQEPPIVIDMGAYIGGSGELSQEQLFQNSLLQLLLRPQSRIVEHDYKDKEIRPEIQKKHKLLQSKCC